MLDVAIQLAGNGSLCRSHLRLSIVQNLGNFEPGYCSDEWISGKIVFRYQVFEIAGQRVSIPVAIDQRLGFVGQ